MRLSGGSRYCGDANPRRQFDRDQLIREPGRRVVSRQTIEVGPAGDRQRILRRCTRCSPRRRQRRIARQNSSQNGRQRPAALNAIAANAAPCAPRHKIACSRDSRAKVSRAGHKGKSTCLRVRRRVLSSTWEAAAISLLRGHVWNSPLAAAVIARLRRHRSGERCIKRARHCGHALKA